MSLMRPQNLNQTLLAVVVWIGIALSYADPLLRSHFCAAGSIV